ncbi:MAG: DUF3494 domain-containing protein [Ignavibacteriales bacterium]|nr:DUF3494 domain-containing protein [Ignavibacteriales bacterium]
MNTLFLNVLLNKCLHGFFTLLIVALVIPVVCFAQTTVNLGTASSFAVLAAAGISNTGGTTLNGDIGSYPTATITGFPPGTFTGTNHLGDATTQGAMTDLNIAYFDAADRAGASTIGTELGGSTLTAGIYSSGSGTFGLTGTLTLDGQNNADAVFIFQMATTFTTTANSSIVLINGAMWSNIFWQVGSSATLGTNSIVEGTILANTSITANNLAVLHGRLLAGAVTVTGTVTLSSNTVVPVELTSFTAVISNSKVRLNWNTATEVNNSGFEIQRSPLSSRGSDSQNYKWMAISFIAGAGNSNSSKDYSYIDDNARYGKFAYRLKQIDNDGNFSLSNIINVDLGTSNKYSLGQNYPNPFNPTTKIDFNISTAGRVSLKVFNTLGNEEITLVNGHFEPGTYSIELNANKFNSGIYFYTLQTDGYKKTLKMIVVK